MTFFDLSKTGTLEVILYIFGSKNTKTEKAFIHIKAAQWLIKYIFYDCVITDHIFIIKWLHEIC